MSIAATTRASMRSALVFLQAEAFPVKVGVQGVNDVGYQTTVKKKLKDVVAVVAGSLKPYFVMSAGRAQGWIRCTRVSKPSRFP